ncbi:EpsG family protein [Latilactobacillus sakei]|uniref:EpsG family protein n=1 Tax=Latilactobacillus sakei TaxID=1599 RepID=UPI0015F5D77E|nr:EpsG family protein [Latilactobacillus sakei]QMU87141.1 EpsG family protein [Latilactobacillus sakei]
MAIYFYSLIATIVLSVINDVLYKNGKANLKDGWQAFLISLPLAIVAGLRTLDIGTDVQVYGYGAFKAASSSTSFISYVKAMDIRYSLEYGYAILNFLVSRVTNNINIFLFILSMVTIIPFVLGSLLFRKQFSVPLWIQMGVFWGINYGSTLNIMRQSVAMSILYLAVAFLLSKREHNILLFFILLFCAFEFHRTAAVGIVFFLIFEYIEVIIVRTKFSVRLPILAVIIPSIIIIGASIVKILINTGFLAKYQQYMGTDNWLNQASQGWDRIFLLTIGPLLVVILLSVYLYLSTNKENKRLVIFLLIVLIIDILTQFSSRSGKLFSRLGMYFVLFESISLPLGLNVLFNKRTQIIGHLILMVYIIIIFYTVTKSGSGEIYPYQWIFNFK